MPHYLIRPEATQLSDPADLSGAVLALDVADPGTVGGLTNGTQYIAQEVLLSPVSAPFAPVAAATPPAQMAAPGLAVADQTITVTLAADPADGGSAITGRDLRYSTDQATWTEQTGIAASTDLAGLDPATTYFVQSRAVNAVGAGTWSAAASAATAALPGAAAITA
ncbi:MAG: fibronectin type III domain-containing protein, partial [Pseudomonadota bacterium]